MADCNSCKHRYYSFYNTYYNSEENLIKLLIDHGVMKRTVTCENCGSEIRVTKKSNTYVYRCRKKIRGIRCRFHISARYNTFVGDTRLTIHKIMFLCLYWLLHPLPRQAIIMDEVKLGSGSVVDWSMFCRDVCVQWMLKHRQKIGGLNTIVEIDMSKFGLSKYNVRRAVAEEGWVFGGVQRGENNKFFLAPVQQSDRETLLEVIQQWIMPGTIVISDCWKTYNILDNEDFINLMANSSLEFVSIGRGGYMHLDNIVKLRGLNISVLTDSIERERKSVKYSIPCFGSRKQQFEGYLAEYIFKFVYKREHRMHHFLKAAAALYPP